MRDRQKLPLTSFHWGTYRVEAREGQVLALHPFEEDPDPSPIGQGYLGLLNGPDRITAPMVRKSWLNGSPSKTGEQRSKEDFVELSWDEVNILVAKELRRVIDTHGNESIFAGSYGWASAGRFHHAGRGARLGPVEKRLANASFDLKYTLDLNRDAER